MRRVRAGRAEISSVLRFDRTTLAFQRRKESVNAVGARRYAQNRQSERIMGMPAVDPNADPPTRLAWVPLVNPHAEIRGLYERNLLYASPREMDEAEVPRVRRPRVVARTPDYDFQRRVVEPAFRRAGGHTPIEVIRDDALPKPARVPRDNRNAFRAFGRSRRAAPSRLRGISTRQPRRRRGPSAEYPRGSRAVAATRPRNIHAAAAPPPPPVHGISTWQPRHRRDPSTDRARS